MTAQSTYIQNSLSEYTGLTALQASQLEEYFHLLSEKNRVMNLTRITDFEEVVEKHFADSLVLARYMDLTKPLRVLDLGCGGGIPGIPLKIAFPQLEITLLDSVGKKISFVNEVIQALGLDHAEALHARAEELAQKPDYREQFDLVTSRAVANLATLSEYCLPFVKPGGTFAAYKAGDCEEELAAASRAISLCGGGKAETVSYSLGSNSRTFIFIKKEKHTNRNYPRKAGTPSKSPL